MHLLFKGASQRLAATLIELAREHGVSDAQGVLVPLRLSQQDLANLIGVTRESVNLALSDFRKKGLVVLEGRSSPAAAPARTAGAVLSSRSGVRTGSLSGLVAGVVCFCAAGIGCAPPQQAETPAAFVAAVESAHGRAAWTSRRAVEGRLALTFGGKPALSGRILFSTDAGASRLELDDGTIAVFDGQSAWVSPASSPLKRARFHLLTWPYFAAMPFKLRDPGARLQLLGPRTLRGKPYQAARLTFDPGVGDTPEDWYIVYRDPANGRLEAAAYIVTYGNEAGSAPSEPHAITFEDFQPLDGAQIATTWLFWNWSEDAGLLGEPTGNGKLSDLRFVEHASDAFTRPAGAQEDLLPGR